MLRRGLSPRRRFLLKGALLFALWYDEPHRPTRDADLLGSGPDDAATLIATFRDIAGIDMDDSIAFDPQSVRAYAIREDNRYGGLRADWPHRQRALRAADRCGVRRCLNKINTLHLV